MPMLLAPPDLCNALKAKRFRRTNSATPARKPDVALHQEAQRSLAVAAAAETRSSEASMTARGPEQAREPEPVLAPELPSQARASSVLASASLRPCVPPCASAQPSWLFSWPASASPPSSLFFLRAGAAFFFFADFFFDFAFFAMIDLPIYLMDLIPAGHTRTERPQRGRTWTASGPIDQLDRMNDWKLGARCDLRDAANIARRNHIRPRAFNAFDFTLAQPRCNGGLKNIVSTGGAAAQMSVGHVLHREAELAEKFLRLAANALAMLERTGRMIGDRKSWNPRARRQRQARKKLRYVLGQA